MDAQDAANRRELDKLLAMTPDEYVKCGGNKCPNCRSADISTTDNQGIDGSSAWTEVECDNCGAIWDDVFRLTTFADLKVPH